jgi:hypothetical protein
LKQVDINGDFVYTRVISVSMSDLTVGASIAPNPASHDVRLTVYAESDGEAQWKIVDNAGRVVMNNSLSVKKGLNGVTIDINKLAAGIYFMDVQGGGVSQTMKLQKL